MSHHLVTAADLESQYNLRRGTTYRAARLGLIPFYRVGLKGRGIRFRPAEVLSALRGQSCASTPVIPELDSVREEANQ